MGFGFHHENGIGGSGHDQVQGGLPHFVDLRIENEISVDAANPRCADRAEKRNSGDRQSGGCGDHSDDVGIVFKVVAEDGRDDLGLILEAVREQWPDWPVDQTRDQGFLFRRAAFALEIAARDLAGGVGLFLVVHGQWKEVDAGPWLALGDGGCQNSGLAIGREHRTVGLARHAPGFQDQLAARPSDFFSVDIEHRVGSYAGLPS